ncbi:SAM-dependent methyltransferase [Catellatospora sp. IY07-71]|uniref:HsdM family class I SAM-dependent methyltransferase n=1 Tax=Catellatospora sp. IY07-71 TaxID=2728827 RepID=UPI001BB3F628|nr:N-6 DNA methylase [Catellatospora sp. IY07-71]BCJ73697.1 SAM-dependent methyltransferase [Catellatospora sp. IY07-71]
MESTAEVTAGDIARLAGVGRAAVSNWRKRYADFPQPVGGTTASPTFRLVDVEKWLTTHDRMPEQSGAERLWTALQHGSADPERDIPVLARAIMRPHPPAVEDGQLKAALAVVQEIGVEASLAALVERFVDLRGRRGSVATSAQVAELMAELVAPGGGSVLDPACRTGSLLAAAATLGAARLAGQDGDPDNVAIAAARLFGHADAVDVRPGTLQDDAFAESAVDIVISDPPSGGNWGYDELAGDLRWEYSLPARSEGELAWVQHALARLRPGGRAVLLLPPGVAERPVGRRVRRELLRRGALRAVITLPSGATAPFNTRLHLWMLRRPDRDDRTRDVLLVDTTGEWDEAAATIKAAVRAHEAARPLPDSVSGRAVVVEAVKLSSEDVDLTPARHIPGGRAALSADLILQRREELADLLGRLPSVIPQATAGDGQSPAAEITVGELVKNGLVTIFTDPEVRVRTGDVLVPAIGPRPRVDVAGPTDDGRALGPQCFLLRMKVGYVDPWCFAGFMSSDVNLRRMTSMGSIPRVDVRKAHMPRLPLTRQVEYGERFRRLREFADLLRLAAATGEEVTQMVAEGLVAGTLRGEL